MMGKFCSFVAVFSIFLIWVLVLINTFHSAPFSGGKVKGGRILGKYPRLNDSDPSMIARGRIIPTTPWDAVWNGVANWMGVHDNNMDEVLPNRYQFDKCSDLFSDKDLFTDGVCDCTCSGVPISGPIQTPNPTLKPTNPVSIYCCLCLILPPCES